MQPYSGLSDFFRALAAHAAKRLFREVYRGFDALLDAMAAYAALTIQREQPGFWPDLPCKWNGELRWNAHVEAEINRLTQQYGWEAVKAIYWGVDTHFDMIDEIDALEAQGYPVGGDWCEEDFALLLRHRSRDLVRQKTLMMLVDIFDLGE